MGICVFIYTVSYLLWTLTWKMALHKVFFVWFFLVFFFFIEQCHNYWNEWLLMQWWWVKVKKKNFKLFLCTCLHHPEILSFTFLELHHRFPCESKNLLFPQWCVPVSYHDCSFFSPETFPPTFPNRPPQRGASPWSHLLPASLLSLNNEFQLCYVCSLAMEARHSMELLDMDSSSTKCSLLPSLPSPLCMWLKARWTPRSTTTWSTPSSPCCAAACRLELPPSSTPSQWVWFLKIYFACRLICTYAIHPKYVPLKSLSNGG